MRNAFAKTITELAAVDDRIVLLSGDIGNRLFDDFKRKAPDRFYNCGVAEANMTGMAAGLALCGLRPFTYTITSFATTRVIEQIRVDVCYQNVPVTIVGTGSGLSYASLGPTHHSLEDVAILRAFPNMTVICPADVTEVRLALRAVLDLPGPAYIRLGKKGEPVVHEKPPERFEIGKGIIMRDGQEVCLLGMGNMVSVAGEAADALREAGVSSRVVSLHTIKPLDVALLEESFTKFPVVVVVEEHGRIGGLGGAVAEWLAAREEKPRGRLLAFGTPDRFMGESGDQAHMRALSGLTPKNIADTALRAFRKSSC